MERKMKRNVRLIGITAVAALCALISTGCVSMIASMTERAYEDYGVYDTSVPADQLCELRFSLVYIKSFNGNAVSWGKRVNNVGYIKIPAGTNDFVFDYLEKHENLTDIRSSDGGRTETYTFTTTTNSLEDIAFTDVTMLPGHKYVLLGVMIENELVLYLRDITNTPSRLYGDRIAYKLPKASRTPTELEGTWIASDGTIFTFTGNAFEMNFFKGHPFSQPDIPEKGAIKQGRFEINGNKITMYITKQGLAKGALIGSKALKSADIYTYSFSEGNLILEIEYLIPPMTYLKQ